MIIAWLVTQDHLPQITKFNDGVTPPVEDDSTYFINDFDDLNTVITREEFWAKYLIMRTLKTGVYTVRKK